MSDQPDNLAYFGALFALLVSAFALIVMSLEFWTWRRKSGRQRFALPVVQNEYNGAAISDRFATDFQVFLTDGGASVAEGLRAHLERIAVVAISDDVIIDEVADVVRRQIASSPAASGSREEFLALTDNWVQSADAALFLTILPSWIDPIRGNYEFRKKRMTLFRKIYAAAS